MIVDDSIHKVSFLISIAPNIFLKISDYICYVHGWEISQTQREWITIAAAPLERMYGEITIVNNCLP